MPTAPFDVVTVTLNPAIDQTVTISNFTPGIVNRVEQVRSNPGGKGVNVAVSLADAGHRVAVTGFLGKENSASFEALFLEKQIQDHFVRIGGETRVGIKISDPVLHQTTDINYPGSAPAAADIDLLMAQLADLDCAWVTLGGSLPPGVDPAIYALLIAKLKLQGRNVVLDTSGEPFRFALDAQPDVVKPNIHELEALLGHSLPDQDAVVAAARELLSKGIELVVVSMGREGACFVTKKEVVIAHPPDVEVLSTVGAGDAMVAGLVSAQLQRISLQECARLATAFSVAALTRNLRDRPATEVIKSYSEQVILR